MRCDICGSEHNVKLNVDTFDLLCEECRQEIGNALREIEDWEGEFVRDLQDTSDMPKLRTP